MVVFPVGYVGLGTVSAATWWYLFDEEGPQVSFYQLVSYKTLSCSVCLVLFAAAQSHLQRIGFYYCCILMCVTLHAFFTLPAIGKSDVWSSHQCTQIAKEVGPMWFDCTQGRNEAKVLQLSLHQDWALSQQVTGVLVTGTDTHIQT